jgi:hypothetical protein
LTLPPHARPRQVAAFAVGSDYEFDGPGAPWQDVTRHALDAGPRRRPSRAPGTPAQAGATCAVRTPTTRLRPSRTVRSGHRCRRGERLVRGLTGVRFHRERLPTAIELRHVTMTHRTPGRRVHARAHGPTVGDRERVTLQILAICAC